MNIFVFFVHFIFVIIYIYIGKHHVASIALSVSLRDQLSILTQERFIRSMTSFLLECDKTKLKPRSVELRSVNQFYGKQALYDHEKQGVSLLRSAIFLFIWDKMYTFYMIKIT